MQMQLPVFPSDTKLINPCLGFRKFEDTVFYMHNGSPIFCHEENDLNSYRYICATMVTNRLCKCSELATALGVGRKNIERYVHSLKEKGSDWFFNRVEQRGQCYKFTESSLSEAQKLLNDGISVSKVAQHIQVSEGAIRYHIKKGTLKKRPYNPGIPTSSIQPSSTTQ